MTEGGPSDENNKDNGHHETNEHENGDKHCSVAGDDNDNGDDDKQYLFIIRHGDRWDYANPEWKGESSSRTGDSPLSTLGHQQAQETGKFLDNWLADRGFTEDDITWFSSPFLRCLQTSNEALNAFRRLDVHSLPIRPEYSIFEWDGHGGEWHEDLPSLEERKHYFPRLDLSHESFFVPKLPEPRSAFMARCQKTVDTLHRRYPFKARQILVMVSHAAGCVALAKTLTKLSLSDITPAAPCSIYGFSRTDNTDIWSLDPHDEMDGLNGYTGHISKVGSSTVPWNNFGDGKTKFYTGPPNSRFAPNTNTTTPTPTTPATTST